MDTLRQTVTSLLMLLVLAQSIIFIWQPARDVPIWRSYLISWKRTFSLASKAVPFMLAIQNKKDAREAILILLCMVLCVPGFFILWHALQLLK